MRQNLKLKKMNYKAIIDHENGGFSTDAGVVEVALIVVDEELNEITRYSSIVQRYFIEGTEIPCDYSDKSIEIHGITAEMQEKDGKPPRDVVKDIEAIIQDYQIVEFIGHNARKSDCPRLEVFIDQFSKYEYVEFFPVIIDTYEIAKENFNAESYSLGSLCEDFGIFNELPHRAIGDCEATLKLYKKMIENGID